MVFKIVGDVADGEALDRRKRDRSASIRCARGPPDRITRTWLIKGIITVLIKSRATHLNRRIAI